MCSWAAKGEAVDGHVSLSGETVTMMLFSSPAGDDAPHTAGMALRRVGRWRLWPAEAVRETSRQGGSRSRAGRQAESQEQTGMQSVVSHRLSTAEGVREIRPTLVSGRVGGEAGGDDACTE